jgi:hypothetical protein
MRKPLFGVVVRPVDCKAQNEHFAGWAALAGFDFMRGLMHPFFLRAPIATP